MTLKQIQLSILKKWFAETSNNGYSADETFVADLDQSVSSDENLMNDEMVAR